MISAIPAMIEPASLWKRKPTSRPSPIMIVSETTLRLMSARVRPASTAERAIGRLRKRSMMPLWRSCASPIEVVIPPISTASRRLLADSGGLGDDGSGVELADDEVDHRDEVAVGAVPTGSAFRGLDQRVEPSEQPVRDAAVMPADHEPVILEHPRELLQRLEVARVDLGDPAAQVLLRGVRIAQLVEAVELLGERVRA